MLRRAKKLIDGAKKADCTVRVWRFGMVVDDQPASWTYSGEDSAAELFKIGEHMAMGLSELYSRMAASRDCDSITQQWLTNAESELKASGASEAEQQRQLMGLRDCLVQDSQVMHSVDSKIPGDQCDVCGARALRTPLRRCQRCCAAWYCGAACQRRAWKDGHKAACRATDDFKIGDSVMLKDDTCPEGHHPWLLLGNGRTSTAPRGNPEHNWILTPMPNPVEAPALLSVVKPYREVITSKHKDEIYRTVYETRLSAAQTQECRDKTQQMAVWWMKFFMDQGVLGKSVQLQAALHEQATRG